MGDNPQVSIILASSPAHLLNPPTPHLPNSPIPRLIVSSVQPWLIFGGFVLGAICLTYPLLFHPFSHIPRGDEPAGTVPLFNLWTLQWNIDQLMGGYPNYWNAPIFAPTPGTFAFSETQPLTALLAAPIWLATQSPGLGYNAVVVLFLTLNGWFAFWLLKSWGGSIWAAACTGFIVQSLPFVAQEMGVLQLIALFGWLWSLLFLCRFLQQSQVGRATWSTVLGLALGLPVTFLTCGYYGLFSLLFLPMAFFFQLRLKHVRLKVMEQLVLVAILTILLVGPLLWMQQQILAGHGFVRSANTIHTHSARIADYANFLNYNVWYGQFLGLTSGQGQRLFPGIGLVLLAGLGLWGKAQRRLKGYLLLGVVLGILLSLGLRLWLGNVQPYEWLRLYLPGFSQLRSPFRFALVAQLYLALLASFGLINLERWGQNRGRLLGSCWAFIILLESIALPLPLQPVPSFSQQSAWQGWLNAQPVSPQIIMLPFAASARVEDFEQTTRWMLASRYFQGQIANGYSGFFPPYHTSLRQAMLSFPSTNSLAMLRAMQIKYVIIHHNLPGTPSAKVVSRYAPQIFTDAPQNVAIYKVTP